MKSFKIRKCIYLLILAVLPFLGINCVLGDSTNRGAVFVSSNSATTNSVHMYSVLEGGGLAEVVGSPFTVLQTPEVTGIGTGPGVTLAADPLASQDSLRADKESKLLFVVNAISGSVSSFKIRHHKLIAADTKLSGGDYPVSLAFRNGILYVLNAGNVANIQGFSVDHKGIMQPIPGSNVVLPYAGTFPLGTQGQPQIPQFPGQISFSPNGQQLLILGKEGPDLVSLGFPPTIPPAGVQGPGHMFIYALGPHGIPQGAPTSYTFPLATCLTCSSGNSMKEPFSFTIVGSTVVVVEFFGNSINGPSIFGGSAVSSFELGNKGTLTPINISVPNNQGGACWIAAGAKNQLYITNDTTDNISQYSVNNKGVLTLVNAVAATVGPGPASFPDEAFPLDIAVGNKDQTLYQLTPGPSTAPGALVYAFTIDRKTGNLSLIGTVSVGTTPLNGQMGMATIDY